MHSLAVASGVLFTLVHLGESKQLGQVDGSFVKRILDDELVSKRLGSKKGRRELSVNTPTFLTQHRHFGAVRETSAVDPNKSQQACDASFLSCLQDDKCVLCFLSLQTEGIDWASVTPETPCSDVTQILFDGGHCTEMKGVTESIDTFCNTFDSCVIWDDQSSGGNSTLDCDSLTSCDWEGIHKSFVGDGICHEGIGCYNHEICNYDGGDCCEDTCKGGDNFFYVECGLEGYACRNTTSENCDPSITSGCKKKSDDSHPEPVKCGADETMYRLVMYDSFGDGWDETKLVLTPKDDSKKIVFKGGLEDGAEGTEYVCLSTAPACYHVEVAGGVWGNEVSWEVKPVSKGAPAVGDGGSPMDCEFSVGGEVCMRTCDGKPNKDSTSDPEYKTYKQMYTCMSEKCIIQLETCKSEEVCTKCLSDDAPEYCFANDNFNAVINCGLCHCMDDVEESEYCQDKPAPGALVPSDDDDLVFPQQCSASETLKGSGAVMAFSKCSNFEEIGMMVTEFDESNFGALDAFESCSHSYKNESMHGGRTALGCMQILANAISDPTDGIDNPTAPVEAIKSLAESIYHNAENFCDCAKKSAEECPLCPSFVHFKTLLFETLDACLALDEIDCDAWSEFYTPCKSNIEQMFSGAVDFSDQKQCEYAQNTCGGAGPFPAFRKLDCDREISKEAWDFYTTYEHGCLHSGDDKPSPNPTPKPEPTPSSPTDTPVPVHPNDNAKPSESDSSTPKPYVPSDDPKHTPSKPYKPEGEKKKKSHFFRNLFIVIALAGAGVWYYKKQSGSFDFVHYRRARNYAGDNEMYSSLAMDSGSSSFEPPSLPPTPMNVGGDTI